ncbi:hypothetical protein RJ641_017674 [Dillenia turbinata]|uniref:Brf1 TBP-binding domain-containing protein n=1 Tax=Dillenia turbinata TaxID=194707 RepID=A0AAN8Z148_9MAGN
MTPYKVEKSSRVDSNVSTGKVPKMSGKDVQAHFHQVHLGRGQKTNGAACGRYHGSQNPVASVELESFSNIDAEIIGYLNNKEEMHYKRIIWEAMYKEDEKEKGRKRARETKKNAPAKRAAKTTSPKKTEKRLSSKINYDALKKLLGDSEDGPQNTTDIYHLKSTENSEQQYSVNGDYSEYELEDEHGEV